MAGRGNSSFIKGHLKTKMTKLIVLANSWRPGGRCVAGICPNTGEWMRPISRSKERAIPEIPEVTNLKLLDVVDIPFSGQRPKPVDKYQIENEYVDVFKWEKVGIAKVRHLQSYVQNTGMLFYSKNDRVSPNVLDNLHVKKWNSLQLIRVNVTFSQDHYNPNGWRAIFADGVGNTLDLKVTDPVATDSLNKSKNLNGKCLLTISLGGVWEFNHKCYKLVAGVIKL